jgi:PilZ domain
MKKAMTLEERRHNPRTKLHHIAYMSFGSGNGAIVLDVSQGGLGFEAAAPLESEEPVRFRVLGKSIDRIEVIGELAWNDQTKKSGGLRFTSLPDEFREQILVSLGHPPLSTANSPRMEIKKASTNANDSGARILPKVISSTGNGAKAAGQ